MSPHVNILIPVSLPDWWEELAIGRYRAHAGGDTHVTGAALTNVQQEAAVGGCLADVLYDNAQAAEQDGAGVHVIDCFGDPVMAELRDRLERPVTGVGHAALHFAYGFSHSFAVITSEALGVNEIVEHACAYGVAERLTECLAVDIPAAEIPDRAEETLERLESVAVSLGVPPQMIVLGCTELAEFTTQLQQRMRRQGVQTVVLNPLIAAIRWAEAAALAL